MLMTNGYWTFEAVKGVASVYVLQELNLTTPQKL